MKVTVLAVAYFLSIAAFAQNSDSPNMKAQPKGGKGALQIIYYRIDFTQEETDYLRTHAPELIFSVSESGRAKLEKINDIDRQSIIDSIRKASRYLPEFYPEKVNGRRETGVYFLKLTWPNYQGGGYGSNVIPGTPFQFTYSYPRKLKEFTDITYRARYDMVLGAMLVNFGGNIGRNLDRGWGMKSDFIFYGRKGWGGGFGTTFILAKSLKTDPTLPVRLQDRSHLLTLFCGSFGKIFSETNFGQLAVQVEPAFGLTDIVPTGGPDAPVIGLGFSPGATATYMIRLGSGRMARRYFMPVAYKNFLAVHVSARSLMFNSSQGSGTVYELGLSYRLATQPVIDYKVKE